MTDAAATNTSRRRQLGKALVVLAYVAALGWPAWSYLGTASCGDELTAATSALLLSSPLLFLSGSVVLVARKPRRVGYWALPLILWMPFWYFALLSTWCSTS